MPVKTNVHKDKRAWRLSHEAFLTLQELAHQKGLQTAAFLEHLLVSSYYHIIIPTQNNTACLMLLQNSSVLKRDLLHDC